MEMIRFQLADDERDIFLADVDEHLRALEAGILQLEHHPQRQTFDSLFRSALPV
jgi:chemotaxis protein histidine kinase CheA